MGKGPKLGEPEREAPRGAGRRPQEATLKKAQCPQLWTLSSRPPGLGKRGKGEGRMDLGESFRGGLCVKTLGRMSTSPARPPLCPGPQGAPYTGVCWVIRGPTQTQPPQERVVRPRHSLAREERSWSPTAMKLFTLEFERNVNTVSFNQESVRKETRNIK